MKHERLESAALAEDQDGRVRADAAGRVPQITPSPSPSRWMQRRKSLMLAGRLQVPSMFLMKACLMSPHESMLSHGRLLIHVRTEPPSMRGRYRAQMRSVDRKSVV